MPAATGNTERNGVDLPNTLIPGLRGSVELTVGDEHTAPHVGSGRVKVLATPIVINLLEMRVRAEAELVGVEGRALRFRVSARDEREAISEGTHERVVVNVARFDQRMEKKARGG
jgi:predicted thioesterase